MCWGDGGGGNGGNGGNGDEDQGSPPVDVSDVNTDAEYSFEAFHEANRAADRAEATYGLPSETQAPSYAPFSLGSFIGQGIRSLTLSDLLISGATTILGPAGWAGKAALSIGSQALGSLVNTGVESLGYSQPTVGSVSDTMFGGGDKGTLGGP
jgi:hypothetical protein